MMLVRLCDDVLSVRCRGGQPRAAAAATAARVPLVLLALLVCSERVEYVSGFAFSFGRHPGPGDWAQFSTAALDGPLPVLSRASAFSTSCVPIPRNMSLCQGLEYSRMRLPNLLEHDTIDEALEQSASWVHLHKLRCHADTQKFLCSLFAPVCLETPIFPCRSLCEAVRDACEGAMLKYGYPWPEMVGCEKFPEGEMCVTAGDNNDRGSAVCRACTQPENTESLLDNFCRADFVIRARVRRAKGSTVLKTKMSRVFKVTESIIAEKDLKSPEFRNANMSDCCSSLDRKISKRNPHLLIMGTRDGDGNLVPTFLMEWRRGSMSFKKSVKMMLKINCAHSSAVDINPLDPVSGRKDLSKPVPGAKGQRQFVRKTNEGEGDDEDEDDNDDDEDASKNNSNSRHSNNSNNKGSLEKVRRPLNSASPLSSSSPPPPKIQFDLSENFRRELELHSIAAEQEKKAHEEQQLRQQLGSDKQSSPAPRKRKESRRRKGDRGRAAAGRLPVDRDGSEDDPRLAQKSHKARGREHKRKSAARTTTTPSTTTALQSGDVEVAKERREHAPMSVYHRVPKPHEKHEGRRHNQQEPAGEMEMIVDPVELHGPLKIEKKVHRDELEVRHHSKIHDHKDVSLNRTPYRAEPHHHPKEQQQQHHQQQQQHSHRHQQQHQQQQQQWHVNPGHGDGGPAVQREDSIVTTHKSVHDNKSSNGQHRHSSVEHGLSSELPYIHTPSDEEIVKLAGGEDATSRQSQRHDHHEHQHHHQHQHHGDGEDGGSSRPSKVKVVEEDEVVTQVAEVEQPAGQAGGTHDRHHDHHQHSTQQNHRRPGGHEVRHHEEPQLHHHHRHVHGLEKATTESTETGGGNREVLQKAATLDSPREEEFLTVLPVIPDEMRAKGDGGVAVGEGDDEGSDTTGVNDAYGEVTITSDLSLLRSSSAALDVATTTLATSTSGSAPDVVTTREDPAVKVRDSQKRGRKRKSGRRRHHKKKKANTAEGLTTTTTTATATTTTTAVPPPIESDTVTGPYEAE